MSKKEKILKQLQEAATVIQYEGHDILEQLTMIDNVEDAIFIERKFDIVWKEAGNAMKLAQELNDYLEEP